MTTIESIVVSISLAAWAMAQVVAVSTMAVAGTLLCLILFFILRITRRIDRILADIEAGDAYAARRLRQLHRHRHRLVKAGIMRLWQRHTR